MYKNAPIRAYGNFRLVNFTVKMTLENVGDWKPSYNSENVYETFPGYALHMDSLNSYESGKLHKSKNINCIFYSEAFPAAGIGINNNQSIEFRYCTFIRNSKDNLYHQDKWKGVFFAHASNYECENEYLI